MLPCYVVSNTLHWETEEEKKVWANLRHLILDRHLVDRMFHGVRGAFANNLLRVYTYVCQRVLPFGKPYECVKASEIITECGLSYRTAHRCLQTLLREGFLFKMKNSDGNACFYAPNAPKATEFIKTELERMSPHLTNRETGLEIWREVTESPVFQAMHDMIRAFAGFVVRGVEQVKQRFGEVRSTMANLLDSLKAAKAQAVAVHQQKRAKRAAEPFFTAKGKPDGRAVLEFWHKAVADADCYPHYTPKITGKLIGQAKILAKELKAQDLNEDQMREIITTITRQWNEIPQGKRTIQCTTSLGKAYKILVPVDPVFEFYVGHRTEMNHLIGGMVVAKPKKEVPVINLDDFDF